MHLSSWSDPRASRDELLRELLYESPRDFVPISRAFLQQRLGDSPEPGPAAEFVRSRRGGALDLYLLLHIPGTLPPFEFRPTVDALRRALSTDGSSPHNDRVLIRRQLRWLSDRRLLSVEFRGRNVSVRLLDEAGSGETYSHPIERGQSYFALPHIYWEQDWDLRLSLAAKVVLLIAHSLRPENFLLPVAQASQWYGISEASLQRGLASLRNHGLLRTYVVKKSAPGSPLGIKRERRHTLVGPFRRRPRPTRPADDRASNPFSG